VNVGLMWVNLHRPTSHSTVRPAWFSCWKSPPRSARVIDIASSMLSTDCQGLTLVHFSAQREHFFYRRWVLSAACISIDGS